MADSPSLAVARWLARPRPSELEAECVVHGLSTVAVSQVKERRWVGGGQHARRSSGLGGFGIGNRGGVSPGRAPRPGLPTLRPPRHRYLGTDAVDEAWTTPPSALPRLRRNRSSCRRGFDARVPSAGFRSARHGRTEPCASLSARHLRRIDQPDPAPSDVQQPRPRLRHLALAVPIRVTPRRR